MLLLFGRSETSCLYNAKFHVFCLLFKTWTSLWRVLPIWRAHPNLVLQCKACWFHEVSLPFCQNTPLSDQLEFAYVIYKIWSPVLLKLWYVAVIAIYWKWRNRLSQLHNEFDWVLQYYSRLQHVKLQLSFAYTLKVTSTLICDCCGESLLIVSFISKCWLQLKFQTSYYFHKSYSYCLWPPQLPIFETSFVQLSMPSSPDLSSALYQMEICNVLLLLCKHSGRSDLAENVSLSKASIWILCLR